MESVAKRHFSAVEVVQPKFRATLGIRSVQKCAFVRAQINGEIADYAAALRPLLDADDLDAFNVAGVLGGTPGAQGCRG